MNQEALRRFLAEVSALPEVRSLVSGLRPGSTQLAHGVGGPVRALLAAAVHAARSLPSLYVCSDLEAARRVETDLVTWLGDEAVALLPLRDLSPLGVLAQSGEIQAQRLWVLDALLAGDPVLVVAPVEAAAAPVPPPARLGRATRVIRLGAEAHLHELAGFLVDTGYERVPVVESPGDFALRGGILDLFPPAGRPHRLEFAGDEVASIRVFSAETQKSVSEVQAVRVGPAREWVLDRSELASLAQKVRRELDRTSRKLVGLGRREAASKLAARVEADLERMEAGDPPEDADVYAPYVEPDLRTVLEYLPAAAAVFLDEPARLEQAAGQVVRERAERLSALLENGGLLETQAASGAPDFAGFLRRAAGLAPVYLAQLLRKTGSAGLSNIVAFRHQLLPSFHGQWADFQAELARWRLSGDRVLLLAATEDGVRGLTRSLRDEGIGAAAAFSPDRPAGQVVVTRGIVEGGFYLPGLRIRVVTDAQIRGRTPRKRRRRFAGGVAEGLTRALGSYRELEIGDYVVHVNHGIGVYLGIRSLEIEGVTRDYISIKYEGEDRLYVPTDQVNLIQKYVGVEGQEPRINRLAGGDWVRAKKRARESVQKLAVDLVRLYAVRETTAGHAFAPDGPWQEEFEAGFHYEETPDQLSAVAEIKRDMESPVPMDRLLCGDVGYGKTEVAVRAAFKAVTDGKQVAVLVPTTVLAQQHYHTFRERFSGYPVTVDLLSRFRSRPEQERTLKGLRRGTVDIVIGTHRLLQPDVVFKDLGLLVIDEEHRFGVGHKERLKELKTTVDALVLTATPIPRTLNMALVGLRDMSVIDTPPEDRYPVQTYVLEYDEETVRDAILRELARGGQVFYVHNRVETIDQAALRLRRMLPAVRIAVAHGQMKEDRLERVMIDFLDGEYDVLVSTTIIESGLDLPNVNTLIVEDADKLGLAQLYQLRGRVGRSNRVAYAYFTYRRGRVISEVAEKRLEAIRDFTELGSGYRVALRDLEIRGAGNLLGPEQHGFIASVGFELYCRMLEETIRELKGERPARRAETSLDVSVDAFIPDGYIPDSRQKIETYQRIAAIADPAEADDLEDELTDRFGPPPEPVSNLLLVARVRAAAGALGAVSVSREGGGGLSVRFEHPDGVVREALEGLVGRAAGVSLRASPKAVLLAYRRGRRPSLGDRKKGPGRENAELLRGLLDLLVHVSGRTRTGRDAGTASTYEGRVH
ncbi:MAG: transcription-repair coupling factor [Bacillota bacterium]|jgi:transcription-repair coupling factor (superfamily II helicase)